MIPRGKMFLNRFFKVLSQRWGAPYGRRGDRVKLTPNIIEHIIWWVSTLKTASGTRMMATKKQLKGPLLSWMSDACRCLDEGKPSGAGGFLPFGPGYYWSEVFDDEVVRWLNIAHLECYAVCQNAAIFGHLVEGYQMYDECDNAGVVYALNGSPPSDPVLYELSMKRFDILAQHNMEAVTRHFAGWVNGMADDLSRQNFGAFYQKAREYGFNDPLRLD